MLWFVLRHYKCLTLLGAIKIVFILEKPDIEIKRFRWWSKWIDLSYSLDCTLRVRVNRLNMKEFRVLRKRIINSYQE